MAVQYWGNLLNAGAPWQTTAGTALSTATTATISPQSAGSNDYTLQSNYFYPGLIIEIDAQGFITTTGSSTTLTVLLAANNAGSYTTLATSQGIATGTGTLTGLPWSLTAYIECTAAGSSGNTLSTEASMLVASSVSAPTIGTTNNVTYIGMPSASGATAAAVNTTVPLGLPLRATLAGANATIQCTQYLIKAWS